MAGHPHPKPPKAANGKATQSAHAPSMSKFGSARMVGSYVSGSKTRVLEYYAGRHLGTQASNSRLKSTIRPLVSRDTFSFSALQPEA